MPAILLSLSAAILYGAADFCGGLATRRTSMFSVAVISQLAGFVLLLVVLPFFPHGATAADFGWGALAGLCGGIGLALLYHALSIGKMGVVSPITAVLAAALPLGIGVARGEHLSHAQVLGIAMALVAIVLISVSTEPSGTREISTAGVKEAIASGLVLGGFYLFLSYSRPAAGLESLVTARLASAALVASLAFATGKSLVPKRGTLPLIVFGGAIDMCANACYVLATFEGYLSIAAVLTSLYPASTVFLARLTLDERLATSQKVGVALALGGVALIAFRP